MQLNISRIRDSNHPVLTLGAEMDSVFTAVHYARDPGAADTEDATDGDRPGTIKKGMLLALMFTATEKGGDERVFLRDCIP